MFKILRNNIFVLKESEKCFYSTVTNSFKASEVVVKKTTKPNEKPTNCDNVGFGTVFTDHMLQIDFDQETGWNKPVIKPIENFNLHPSSLVFHYAQEIFEGMKAFYGEDKKIRLFRPDKNMDRMYKSAHRAMFPTFDRQELQELIRSLVSVDKDWVPKKRGHSLYIRPTMIGIDPKLGVTKANQVTLFVLLCPVGAYYPTGFKPVSLLADPKFVRAWPGGTGDAKMGSNYAPTLFVQNEAYKHGCQQALWLFGEDHCLSEVGTMNIFIYWINKAGKREVVTPPLNGSILPGVTRMSLLELLRKEGQIEVSEREVPMVEVVAACEEKRMLEMFGSGTACVVSPVERIDYCGRQLNIPTMENGAPMTMGLLQKLTDIQYGVTKKPEWTVDIP